MRTEWRVSIWVSDRAQSGLCDLVVTNILRQKLLAHLRKIISEGYNEEVVVALDFLQYCDKASKEMVKLLNTPFGNYGYVLSSEPVSHLPLFDNAINEMATVTASNIQPSAYDAKYLRTTDLSKGSIVLKLHDKHSYMKRGLRHTGQQPAEDTMEVQIRLPVVRGQRHCQSEERLTESSNHDKTLSRPWVPPSVRDNWLRNSKEGKKHAGKSTVSRQHRGFASGYAARRSDLGSLASSLGSGRSEMTGEMSDEASDDEGLEKNKLIPTFSGQAKLMRLDPVEMTFSKLGRLKSRRLFEVYSDMFEKHQENRRKLIMDRVRSAEKIKTDLYNEELEHQRNILKSSAESQRNQLRKLRNRHLKSYENRLSVVYTCKSSPRTAGKETDPPAVNVPCKANLAQLSLPRRVFGLPEDADDRRPGTVPGKRMARGSPGKLSLDSYRRARNNLASKFNNVWNTTKAPRA